MNAKANLILYVEDDQDISIIARMALEEVGGFSVTVCASGEEALAAAPGLAPDLILLDVMMPGMDGPTTLAALRQVEGYGAIPVIFMTAKVMHSEMEEYKALGALGVIPKPFDPMTLADRIREIMGG